LGSLSKKFSRPITESDISRIVDETIKEIPSAKKNKVDLES